MQSRGSVLIAWTTALILAPSAYAGQFGVSVDCAGTATVGQNVAAVVTLSSRECFPTTARIISSIIGNANGSLGGLGVYGPVVTNSTVAVPAATDNFPPGCFVVIPGEVTIPVTTAPMLDAALEGTVATIVIAAEFEGGQEVSVGECLVEVLP